MPRKHLAAMAVGCAPVNAPSRNIDKGYPPAKTARQIMRAIRSGRFEQYVGRPFSKEWLALHCMRFFPSFTIRLLRKAVPE